MRPRSSRGLTTWEVAMTNPDNTAEPLTTSAEILEHVVYSSPAEWDSTQEEALLEQLIASLMKMRTTHIYYLAWPDGVHAILPSNDPLGSPQMDQAVVNTYRAAVGGSIGPVVVGTPL